MLCFPTNKLCPKCVVIPKDDYLFMINTYFSIMQRLIYIFFGAIAVLFASCSNNNLYDDMPQEIQKFISQYYPNSALESFTSSETSYTVIIKNGPTMTFNDQYRWIQVNGNGMPLPQVLLFNDFPPSLYEYLQESENTNDVFNVTRNKIAYTVQLTSETLTYTIADGEIRGNSARKGR